MDAIEAFLDLYGVIALFVLMLTKAAGVPVPIPADVIMLAAAARAAEGKWPLWQVFGAILLALILGGIVQFVLARGPGRGMIYRFGRYLGLTPARLDGASAAVRRGGPIGIGVSILTPGVRSAAVVACGLAGVPMRTFLAGLALGSTAFLSLHFAIGYLGGPLLARLGQAVPVPWLLLLALLVAGLAVWVVIRRRQRPGARGGQIVADAVGAWHEATCPACLVLGAAQRHLTPVGSER